MNEPLTAADSVGISQEQGDYVIKCIYTVLKFHKIPPKVLLGLGLSIFSNTNEQDILEYTLCVKHLAYGIEWRTGLSFPVGDEQMRDIATDLTVWLKLIGEIKNGYP